MEVVLGFPVIAAGVWGIQVGKLRDRGGWIFRRVRGGAMYTAYVLHRHVGESAMYTCAWP